MKEGDIFLTTTLEGHGHLARLHLLHAYDVRFSARWWRLFASTCPLVYIGAAHDPDARQSTIECLYIPPLILSRARGKVDQTLVDIVAALRARAHTGRGRPHTRWLPQTRSVAGS